MELDLDYNTVVYDQLILTDRLGTNQHNLNTNVHPQNLFPIKLQLNIPAVSCLPNPNGAVKYKVTEVLIKQNDQYICPGCNRAFKPRGITNHVNSCAMAKAWCIQNRII